jgi:hypothetical protein
MDSFIDRNHQDIDKSITEKDNSPIGLFSRSELNSLFKGHGSIKGVDIHAPIPKEEEKTEGMFKPMVVKH